MVGLTGLEPVTSALSGQRSNRLSYRPARSDTLPQGSRVAQLGCPAWTYYEGGPPRPPYPPTLRLTWTRPVQDVLAEP